jgi:hypothetical protein
MQNTNVGDSCPTNNTCSWMTWLVQPKPEKSRKSCTCHATLFSARPR